MHVIQIPPLNNAVAGNAILGMAVILLVMI